MIDIKIKYQAVLFGNFTDIIPSPDIVSRLIQLFKDKALLPGTFQEVGAAGLQTRISLASTNNEWSILFGLGRVDVIKNSTTLDGKNLGTIEGFTEEATIIFRRIMKDFNIKGIRISLISNDLLKEMLSPQLNAIYLKLFNPIPLYKDHPPFQWNTRSIAEFETDMNGPTKINVISTLTRNQGRMMSQDQFLQLDRIEVEFDINTSNLNQDLHFDIDIIEKFFIEATKFRTQVLNEMEVILGA